MNIAQHNRTTDRQNHRQTAQQKKTQKFKNTDLRNTYKGEMLLLKNTTISPTTKSKKTKIYKYINKLFLKDI